MTLSNNANPYLALFIQEFLVKNCVTIVSQPTHILGIYHLQGFFFDKIITKECNFPHYRRSYLKPILYRTYHNTFQLQKKLQECYINSGIFKSYTHLWRFGRIHCIHLRSQLFFQGVLFILLNLSIISPCCVKVYCQVHVVFLLTQLQVLCFH